MGSQPLQNVQTYMVGALCYCDVKRYSSNNKNIDDVLVVWTAYTDTSTVCLTRPSLIYV